MKKLHVSGLASDATEASVNDLFSPFGRVHSVKLANDVFSGLCRGFGFIEMEGHEARAAIQALDGRTRDGRSLKVRYDEPRKRAVRRGRRR